MTTTVSDTPASASDLRTKLADLLRDQNTVRTPAVDAALRSVPRHLFLPASPPRRRTSTRPSTPSTAESRLRRTGIERHHVVFGPLSRALRGITSALGSARLWLLLDEWSSVPLTCSPLLADLLRRSVLPTAGITVKVAAIERRSRFSQPSPSGDYVGIEVGADEASAVNLDDFMIFDNARGRAQEFFGQLFFNHASTRLSAMLAQPQAAVSPATRIYLE